MLIFEDEGRGHKSQDLSGGRSIEVGNNLRWHPERKQGLQSYSLKELNSAKIQKRKKLNPTLEGPERKTALPGAHTLRTVVSS